MTTKSGGSGTNWADDVPESQSNVVNQGGIQRQVSEQRSYSWADVLGRSIVSDMNKNILEVVLEKDYKGSFNISDTDCVKFLLKLGLDMKTGRHVDGVQILMAGV